jgi:hypothetical protein
MNQIITRVEDHLPAAPQEPEGVTSLVQLAINKGVDVEVLERLVALQERVTERNARASFFKALAEFRSECPPIKKTQINTQFEVTRDGVKRAARYAPLDEIDRIARPVAANHGLTWTWDTTVDEKLMHVICRVLHVDGHSEATTVAMPHGSNAGSSPQQKFGSTQTYGMRYSLIAALGLTTTDEDADGAGGKEPPQPITAEQAADLSDLIDSVGANRKKFLHFMNVEKLSDIPAGEYKRAVDALEERRGK